MLSPSQWAQQQGIQLPSSPPPGTLSKIGSAIGNFFTGNTQKFGNTMGNALAAPGNTDLYSQALQSHSDIQNALQAAILKKEKLGQDTTKLKAALNDHVASIPQQTDFTGNVINKSNEQVLGEAGGTGLEALSGGLLSSGAEAATSKGLSFGQRFVQGAKIAAPYGVVGGISAGMQNNQSPAGVLASGAAGGTITAAAGGTLGSLGGLVTDHFMFKPNMGAVAGNELDAAAQKGITGQNLMNTQATQFRTGLGENFQNAANQIQSARPDLKMNLPSEAVDALKEIKTTKNFSLPQDLLDSIPDISKVETGDVVSLNAPDTQELIRQLNKATFSTKANGDLVVNQKLINLTNSIKNSAKDAFGGVADSQGSSVWNKAYSDYSSGKNALEKINDLINIERNPTASDLNKTMNNIQKLGDTPTGKIQLQNILQEFKQTSGIDFTDPVKDIHAIMDKQGAFNDITKEMEKGTFLQRFKKGATNPEYLGKRLVEGAVISIIAYGWLRKLAKQVGIAP